MAFPVNLTAAVDGVTEILAAHLNNLEEKVGINSSGAVTSLDFLLKNPLSSNPGHVHTLAAIPAITATAAQINYLTGVTSAVQTQLNGKASAVGGTFTGDTLVSHDGLVTLGAETTNDVAASGASVEALSNDVNAMIRAYPINATGSLLGAGKAGRAYLLASGSALTALMLGTAEAADIFLCTDDTSRITVAANGDLSIGNYRWIESTGASYFGDSPAYGAGVTALAVCDSDQAGSATCTMNVESNFNVPSDGIFGVIGLRTILEINNSGDDLSGNDMQVGSSAAGQEHYVTVAKACGILDNICGSYLSVGVKQAVTPITGTITKLYGHSVYVDMNNASLGVTSLYAYRADHDGNGTITNFYGFSIGAVVAVNAWGLYIDASMKNYLGGSLGIGTTTFGTSAAKVLGLGNGTAPATAPADMVQMWSGDIGGSAGKAGLHMMAESGTNPLVVAGVIIKTDTGDPAQIHETIMCINTFDNTVKIYADGGWRTIASGW
jgi:hypothetical protein